MDFLTQTPIAHRGFHKTTTIPENSFYSIQEAILNKYDIEIDVRVTKDKKVVVFHDNNTFRMCGVDKEISKSNYEDLSKLKLYDTEERIPLLKDILELVNNQIVIYVEIKNFEKVGEFEELVFKELEAYNGRYAICSFNIEVVKWFSKNQPYIKRGFIYGDLSRQKSIFFYFTFLYNLLSSKADFVSLDYNLLDSLIPKICKLLKKPLISWTIDDKDKLEKAEKIVDNVIFESLKPKKYK